MTQIPPSHLRTSRRRQRFTLGRGRRPIGGCCRTTSTTQSRRSSPRTSRADSPTCARSWRRSMEGSSAISHGPDRCRSHFSVDGAAEVCNLYVLQEFQGRGIGRALLEAALSRIGGHDVVLSAFSSNEPASASTSTWGSREPEPPSTRGPWRDRAGPASEWWRVTRRRATVAPHGTPSPSPRKTRLCLKAAATGQRRVHDGRAGPKVAVIAVMPVTADPDSLSLAHYSADQVGGISVLLLDGVP